MAHNTVLNPGVGGDTVVDVDLSLNTYPTGTGKLSAGCIYVSANSTTAPTPVTAANAFYVQPGTGATWAATQSGSWTVSVSGTVTVSGTVGISGTVTVDTELPAAAALADATANPTITAIGTFCQFYNGTTWDRMRGDTTNGLWVNVKSQAALPAGTNVIGHVIVDSGTVTTVSTVTSLTQFNGNAISTNSGVKDAGTLRVVLATDQPQLTNKLLVTPDAGSTVQDIPNTSGGLTIYRNFQTSGAVIAAAIKASPGQVYGIEVTNINSTPVYVRLYNQTASPATTDTPVWSAVVPGNTAGAGIVRTWDKGMAFGTGIGIRITNLIADNDNTALTASTVMVNMQYK